VLEHILMLTLILLWFVVDGKRSWNVINI